MSAPAQRAFLSPINRAATRWHRLFERLAGMEVSGDRGLVKQIGDLEAELESFWNRRRRLLALAFARSERVSGLFQDRAPMSDRHWVHVMPLS